jgi:hypothetical protein
VFRICNEIARNKAMYKAEHTALDGGDGIKMPTMTDGVGRGVNSMWLIGSHDPKKSRCELE